jgi:hypothetical protein
MSVEYKVGYGKPPLHTRFKPGNRANPHGRPAEKPESEAEIVRRVLNSPAEYRSGRKVYRATNMEVLIKKFGSLACQGDVKAADELLKMRSAYAKLGDVNPQVSYMYITAQESRF